MNISVDEAHRIGVFSIAYDSHEELVDAFDLSDSSLKDKHRCMSIEVAFSCDCDIYEEPCCGNRFLFCYAGRWLLSNGIYTSKEEAMEEGKKAIDRMLERWL